MKDEKGIAEQPLNLPHNQIIDSITVLPVSNLVVYPHMAAAIVIDKSHFVKALEEALQHDEMVMILLQRDSETESPSAEDLHKYGILVRIEKLMKLPEENLHAVVQGVSRGRVLGFLEEGEAIRARIELQSEKIDDNIESKALVHNLVEQFQRLIKLVPKMSEELSIPLINLENQP